MGLHYRINLQTGKKEARNLREDDTSTTPSSLQSISPELEKKLKEVAHSPDAPTPIPKKRFENLEELKEKLMKSRKEFKQEAELISRLFQDLKKAKDSQDVVRILDFFSYLVHQIDNALWFIEAGGLEKVITPMLINQTDPLLRTNALIVLGTLTQNNPRAKIDVFENNFGNHIAKIITDFETNPELSSAIFAFGSLLRRFPAAQKEILDKFGIKTLTSVLLNKRAEMKNVIKTLTLLADLYEEIQETSFIDLNYALLEHQFCESVENVTIKRREEFSTELAEYMLPVLKTFERICGHLWYVNADLRHALLTMSNSFLRRDEEYSTEVAEKIFEVVQDFYGINRDEL